MPNKPDHSGEFIDPNDLMAQRKRDQKQTVKLQKIAIKPEVLPGKTVKLKSDLDRHNQNSPNAN